ncbi:MAG TPA: RHS repeat-associated core domain-containing protein [Flavobacteriales bacterium]|nr:RHS repeat-associated core domain-containing protein [Flavobacteriales bacterium]
MVNPIWSCSKASPAYRWRPRYDIKGQLLEVTDPLGRVNFEHKYDTAGNNLWTRHLDSGIRTVVVDALGQPLYSDMIKGGRTYTSHDRIGRPTGVWARNKATELFTKRQVLIYGDQQYDVWPPEEKNLKGRLYQHYDEAGKVQVEGYDFKGNPLEKTRRMIKDDQAQPLFVHVVDWTGLDESILNAKTYTTTLAYDALNRVLGTLLPEDVNNHRAAVRPTYNRAGALRSVLVDEAPYLLDIAYNAKGQRLLMAMANGMMTRYAYDPLNFRLLRIRSEKFTMGSPVMYVPNGGVQQDLGYRYDLVGNIIGIRDKAPANHSAEGPGDLLKLFAYDPLKRLLTATGRESTAPSALPLWDAGIRAHDHTATNTYTRAYTYDKVGNVLQEQHTADGHAANSFTKTFNYHPAGNDNRLVSYEVGGLTFPLTCDANGNQLKETTSRFHQWDHADLLKYFMVQAAGQIPSVWAHYFYDAAGTRVKKIVSKQVGGNLLQEVTVYIDGVFEETYVQTNGNIDPNRHYNTLHIMDGRSRIATIRVGNDVEDPTPTIKFNLEDHLGTSSVMVNTGGDLINREEYYPFGETSFGAFAKKRYRYVGKEKDNESGLYYYGARYYAGWMCRFISVDPLADKYAQLTPYNYAANDPIGDFDIDGRQNNKTEQAPSAQDPMNFNDILPNNAAESTKPAVVQRMEREIQSFESSGTKQLSKSNTTNDRTPEKPSNLDGSLAKELVSPSLELLKEHAGTTAERIELENIATGRKIDNHGNTRQSPGQYENALERAAKNQDTWKNQGNQYFTTTGQGHETVDVKAWKKVGAAAEGLGMVMDIWGVMEAAKGTSSPFAAIPLVGSLTVIADEKFDQDMLDMLDLSIQQGYDDVKSLLSGMPKTYSDYRLIEVNDVQMEKIVRHGFENFGALPGRDPDATNAILVARTTERERGPYAVVVVWANQFNPR